MQNPFIHIEIDPRTGLVQLNAPAEPTGAYNMGMFYMMVGLATDFAKEYNANLKTRVKPPTNGELAALSLSR